MFYKRKTLMLAAALVTALTAGVVVALVTNQTEIERDAFGSAGGRMASSNFDTEFIAGQPTSTETSESANFSETAGFLAAADITPPSDVCYTFEFSVVGGAWYMISLPVVPEDNAVATLFPQAIAAFGWNFNTQTYEVTNALDPGRAYWLLLLQTATVEVCGQPFATYTDNYDQQGWDMIGAVSESSPVVDDPDGSVIAMFGWNEATQTYVPVDPMQAEPKEGYWILVFGVPSSVTVGGDGSSPLNKVASTENLSQFYERFGERPPVPPSHDAEESELESPPLPQYIDLSQNYPNPFNPETVIEYQLPEAAQVKLAVYTILGQKVSTLVDEGRPAGYHRVIWDGTDETGQKLASGVYIYRIQVEDFVQTRKIVLLK